MKKILLFPIFSLLVLGLLFGFSHPLYVSVSQIKYNGESKSLEIACKIFVDDLEQALKDREKASIYLGLENEVANADDLVAQYLADNLKISMGEKLLGGNFLGKEIQDDVIWSYIEIMEVPYPHELSIENTLLLDDLEGQQNIVHVRVNGKEKSLRLFKGRSKEVLSFE